MEVQYVDFTSFQYIECAQIDRNLSSIPVLQLLLVLKYGQVKIFIGIRVTRRSSLNAKTCASNLCVIVYQS